MNTNWKTIIWQQLGASIDMLENAIKECRQEVWGDRPGYHEFWYIAYHTLFFLDYYLSESGEGFVPPTPFTLGELVPSGLLPERVYTHDEILSYLGHCRKKCQAAIGTLTNERARQRCGFERPDVTVAELLLYNMRHVQHHAAQLNLILRQKSDSAPRWVTKTKIRIAVCFPKIHWQLARHLIKGKSGSEDRDGRCGFMKPILLLLILLSSHRNTVSVTEILLLISSLSQIMYYICTTTRRQVFVPIASQFQTS